MLVWLLSAWYFVDFYWLSILESSVGNGPVYSLLHFITYGYLGPGWNQFIVMLLVESLILLKMKSIVQDT